MQGNSESNIGQQDRQDHVVQNHKTTVERKGKGTCEHARYGIVPIFSGTFVLRGLVGVRMTSPLVKIRKCI